jgi:hypothetical protein
LGGGRGFGGVDAGFFAFNALVSKIIPKLKNLDEGVFLSRFSQKKGNEHIFIFIACAI